MSDGKRGPYKRYLSQDHLRVPRQTLADNRNLAAAVHDEGNFNYIGGVPDPHDRPSAASDTTSSSSSMSSDNNCQGKYNTINVNKIKLLTVFDFSSRC